MRLMPLFVMASLACAGVPAQEPAAVSDSSAVDTAAAVDPVAFGNKVRARKSRQLAELMTAMAQAAAPDPRLRGPAVLDYDRRIKAQRRDLAVLFGRLAEAYERNDTRAINSLSQESAEFDQRLKALAANQEAEERAFAFERRVASRPDAAKFQPLVARCRAALLRKAEAQIALDRFSKELVKASQEVSQIERSLPDVPADGQK